jgi:hypothetical protein
LGNPGEAEHDSRLMLNTIRDEGERHSGLRQSPVANESCMADSIRAGVYWFASRMMPRQAG